MVIRWRGNAVALEFVCTNMKSGPRTYRLPPVLLIADTQLYATSNRRATKEHGTQFCANHAIWNNWSNLKTGDRINCNARKDSGSVATPLNTAHKIEKPAISPRQRAFGCGGTLRFPTYNSNPNRYLGLAESDTRPRRGGCIMWVEPKSNGGRHGKKAKSPKSPKSPEHSMVTALAEPAVDDAIRTLV